MTTHYLYSPGDEPDPFAPVSAPAAPAVYLPEPLRRGGHLLPAPFAAPLPEQAGPIPHAVQLDNGEWACVLPAAARPDAPADQARPTGDRVVLYAGVGVISVLALAVSVHIAGPFLDDVTGVLLALALVLAVGTGAAWALPHLARNWTNRHDA